MSEPIESPFGVVVRECIYSAGTENLSSVPNIHSHFSSLHLQTDSTRRPTRTRAPIPCGRHFVEVLRLWLEMSLQKGQRLLFTIDELR